jgi:hypothetical protein
MAASTIDDWTRSIIGIGIAFASLSAIILAWTYRSTTDAQAISAGMTALVGSILGYYFGAKGVDAAQGNAADQTAKKAKTEAAADQYQSKVQDLIQKQREAHADVFAMPKEHRLREPKAASVDATVSELSKLDWKSFYKE